MSSSHILKIKTYGKDEQFIGECSCRLKTLRPMEYRKEVEDWHHGHMRVVEQARLALGTKTPQLSSMLKWYRKQEQEGPRADRPLWKQLADELEARVQDDPTEGMEPLFEV